MKRPRVLVVGAGAVGQGYALALQRGGADVTFFVKPHHDERLAKGMPIREVGMFSEGPLGDLAYLPRVWDWDDVARETWDAIWLAVDGTALHGDWVAELGKARGDATVVVFQTGTTGRDHLRQWLPEAAIVTAMIPFVAWWAPLSEDEVVPDGPHMKVWHPPLMATPLSGPLDRVADIATRLRLGGLKVRVLANAGLQGAMGSSVLLPIIAGLEVAGWDLRAFGRLATLRPVVAAVHEARRIVGRLHNTQPGGSWLLQPILFSLATRLAPLLAPFDVQTYLRVHFTKVGAQTAASLADLEAAGDAHHIATPALTALRAQLGQTRTLERTD